eukprot:853274-Rhodomonas_salina.1
MHAAKGGPDLQHLADGPSHGVHVVKNLVLRRGRRMSRGRAGRGERKHGRSQHAGKDTDGEGEK